MARKNRIIVIINCSILALHSILIFAITTFPVYALSLSGLQTTIASVIISLLLQTGTAPVNQSYIDLLNSSYGVESSIGTIEDMISSGLLTESGNMLIDTGLSTAIESQPAYIELGLSDLFTTTVDDVAGGVLAGSGGVNLANTAINCGTAGTIGAFAGAATIGVGLGVLINKVGNYVGNFIKYGLPMSATTRREIANNFPEGYDKCYYSARSYKGRDIYASYYFATEGTTITAYQNLPTYTYQSTIYNVSDTEQYMKQTNYLNSTITHDYDRVTLVLNDIRNGPSVVNSPDNRLLETNFPIFETRQEADNYIQGIKNGTIEPNEIYSPDIIGNQGNQKPDQLVNMIPNGYDMTPVDMDDYQNYMDLANDNTENDDIGQEQAADFENLIDSLLVEPSIIPDQGVDIPTIPDRPIIPGQPDIPPKDPITDQEQETINAGLANTELANVFPFCIPFDIYAMFGNLKAGREAPVLVYEFPEQFGWGAIEIDLTPYEEAAKILRTMELLLFIIGLAINTRPLIGAL